MTISIFPSPTLSTLNKDYFTIAAANTQYKYTDNFSTGVYRLTSGSSGVVGKFIFYNNSSVIGTGTTVSGTVDFNLATAATSIIMYAESGTDNQFAIEKVGDSAAVSSLSGTLDTLTNTQTYNQTGLLAVIAIGGGAGGGGTYQTTNAAGAGGDAGSLASYIGYVNTSTSVTIGAAGTGGPANGNGNDGNAKGNSGGQTSFGNLAVAAGGVASNSWVGGTTGGQGGGPNIGAAGSGGVVANPFLSVKSGTNGGGGGGGRATGAGNGGGSGIGTGGAGGNTNNAAVAGTGYGSGGGGGRTTPVQVGADGTAGVVYVLRGF